ncbi:Sec-independent protein translocase protein TatB, partial [Desulfovibrio sp. 1188_IL3213]|uniref:Sec-independent protein translocase protein TatB n=1 Tax=Desulfovibrio sp. 1188_IL3213 TaxID=3084052 RepID=UPI002FD9C76C
MFGIGSTELLVILVVALIVLGPKSLANVSRTLGKAMGEFRRVSTDFQRTLNAEAEEEEQKKRKKEAAKAAREAAKAEAEAAQAAPQAQAQTAEQA